MSLCAIVGDILLSKFVLCGKGRCRSVCLIMCYFTCFRESSLLAFLWFRPTEELSTTVCRRTTTTSSSSQQIVQSIALQRTRLNVVRQFWRLLSIHAFVTITCRHLTAIRLAAFICRLAKLHFFHCLANAVYDRDI